MLGKRKYNTISTSLNVKQAKLNVYLNDEMRIVIRNNKASSNVICKCFTNHRTITIKHDKIETCMIKTLILLQAFSHECLLFTSRVFFLMKLQYFNFNCKDNFMSIIHFRQSYGWYNLTWLWHITNTKTKLTTFCLNQQN